LKELNLMLNWV